MPSSEPVYSAWRHVVGQGERRGPRESDVRRLLLEPEHGRRSGQAGTKAGRCRWGPLDPGPAMFRASKFRRHVTMIVTPVTFIVRGSGPFVGTIWRMSEWEAIERNARVRLERRRLGSRQISIAAGPDLFVGVCSARILEPSGGVPGARALHRQNLMRQFQKT